MKSRFDKIEKDYRLKEKENKILAKELGQEARHESMTNKLLKKQESLGRRESMISEERKLKTNIRDSKRNIRRMQTQSVHDTGKKILGGGKKFFTTLQKGQSHNRSGFMKAGRGHSRLSGWNWSEGKNMDLNMNISKKKKGW